MSKITPWLLAARPKTLPAAASPVLLAGALAWRDDAYEALPFVLALCFALLIQVATNYANDYFDFVKGADTAERQGPARAVASGMVSPRSMLRATGLMFAAAFIEGLCLLPYGGWPLVFVGVASVLFGLAYTGGPWPLAYTGLADIFVLLFFGGVAVTMTYYVQAGEVTADSLLLSIAPGALATNILVVNNYRDMETDRAANKRTLIVRFGRPFGAFEYAVMLALAHAVPLILFATGGLEPETLILPLLTLPFGILLLRKMVKSRTRQDYDRALGMTAAYLMLFSLMLGLALTASA
jgi:1,4-dihydroxy-2-naphthoate octaprenyltransferase